jgi:hypothetical protein
MKKYWNNQIYAECQLVSIWNAAIFYGIPVPERYGKTYRWYCRESCAIHGGALNIELITKNLRLYAYPFKLSWMYLIKNIPCEFSIFCKRGYHSVLVVAVNIKNKKVLLTNYARNRTYWMPWKTLRKKQNRHRSPVLWKINENSK